MSKLDPNGEFEDINSVISANFSGATSGVRGSAAMIMSATGSSTSALSAMQSSGDIQLARRCNREGEAIHRTGQLEQATQPFQQTIKLDGNYGQTFSNPGLAYQKNGNITEAVWVNRKATSLADGADTATTHANPYYNTVKTYETVGQNADVLQHYQPALRDAIL